MGAMGATGAARTACAASFLLQNARSPSRSAVSIPFPCAPPGEGVAVLVGALAVADLTIGACFAWRTLYTGYAQERSDTYYSESTAQVAWLKQRDTGTWRMERTFTRAGDAALNEAMGCDYLGLSSYSSAHNQSALDFIDALGYSEEGLLHVRYAKPQLAADALLGVKYASCGYQPAGMGQVEGAPSLMGAGIYENPYALSLGYMVADSAAGASLAGENPFERQNRLASALTGHGVQLYKRADAALAEDTENRKTWQVSVPAGCLGYAYVQAGADSRADASKEPVIELSVDRGEPEREASRFQHAARPFGAVEGRPAGPIR